MVEGVDVLLFVFLITVLLLLLDTTLASYQVPIYAIASWLSLAYPAHELWYVGLLL